MSLDPSANSASGVAKRMLITSTMSPRTASKPMAERTSASIWAISLERGALLGAVQVGVHAITGPRPTGGGLSPIPTWLLTVLLIS